MGKKGIYLLLFLLIITSVSAFDVEISPATRTILPNETADFQLTITHNEDKTQYFEIYSQDVIWDIRTNPVSDRVLEVPAGQSKTTTVLVRPLYVNPGYYGVPLNIKRSGTSEVIKTNLEVGLTRNRIKEFAPAVKSKLEIEKVVDPREKINVKIILENENRRNIGKVDLKIRSDLINKDLDATLGPLQKKELSFSVFLDPYTPPTEDWLRLTVFTYMEERTVQFDLSPVHYSVKRWGDTTINKTIDSGFLSSDKLYYVINDGNEEEKEIIREEASMFKRLFTVTEPSASLENKDDGTYYIWELDLQPGERAEVKISTDYRLFFLLILVLVVFVVVYFVIRSPITVTKAAMVVETKEGGISELKVIVNIKNRSTHTLHDLVIQDLVPHIAEVKKDFEMGTLKPEKILTHDKKGTQLKWSISELDGNEERILSYKVRTHLSVLGGLKLPPARITYRFFKYQRKVYSNLENLFAR